MQQDHYYVVHRTFSEYTSLPCAIPNKWDPNLVGQRRPESCQPMSAQHLAYYLYIQYISIFLPGWLYAKENICWPLRESHTVLQILVDITPSVAHNILPLSYYHLPGEYSGGILICRKGSPLMLKPKLPVLRYTQKLLSFLYIINIQCAQLVLYCYQHKKKN